MGVGVGIGGLTRVQGSCGCRCGMLFDRYGGGVNDLFLFSDMCGGGL